MADYVSVEQARDLRGLRIVIIPGVPSPWGEALKGICRVKRLSYVRVRQDPAGPNVALKEWTAQTSAPVAIYNDERPRSTWIDQLCLAERLAPAPRLIPQSIDDRMMMFGLSNELCGENGLGWSLRSMMFHAFIAAGTSNPDTPQAVMAAKYNYDPAAAERAPARVAQLLRRLAAQLDHQRGRSRFLIGSELSALDIYWAAFAALILPLPHELCPMPSWLRAAYTNTNPVVAEACAPALFELRDFIYREYLELPLDL